MKYPCLFLFVFSLNSSLSQTIEDSLNSSLPQNTIDSLNSSLPQNIIDLRQQLQAANTTAEKIQLNYQLGEAYLHSNIRDNEKGALRYAKAAHDLAKQGNVGMAARSAFLIGSIYRAERDYRNQEVWFRTTENYAKRAKDSDLIIKSVVERGRVATRDRNYRRAAQIYEEAFNYFSQKGTSISELESQFEQEKTMLERQKRKLEQERKRLEANINNLSSERDELVVNQDLLISRKIKSRKRNYYKGT